VSSKTISLLLFSLTTKNQSFYGVFDWASKGESDDDIRFRRFLSSVVTRVPVEQDPDQFKHASPCFWFSENRSQIDFPVLLVHGKNDSIAGGLKNKREEKRPIC
jgi:hypothetical protein